MRVRPLLACLIGAGLGAGLLPQPAAAQASGDGFLFRPPVASLTLRGGFHHANAGSDIFDFTTEQLTVGRRDFGGPLVGTDLAIRLSPRFDLSLGAAYAGARAASEFRDWVGSDDLPIEQTTNFERVPLTASVKAYLAPRGRSIGSFAWIPDRVSPYIGAGGGAMWYRFRQEGEFVDFRTLDVFRDDIQSSGWAPTGHGMAGLDVWFTSRIGLTGEARYTVARAELRDAFEAFEPIDLSGLAASVGIQVRF
jgi:hypothetical protein